MTAAVTAAPKPRLRLWQITGGYHCAILGTCLELEQTRRILARAKVPGVSRLADYELHCVAVEAAKSKGPIAKLLHRALDRVHQVQVRSYGKLADADALREAWRADARAHAVEGAFWALMTHPSTDEALRSEAFGTVHMLSHQVGHTRREALEKAEHHAEAIARLEAESLAGEERATERETTLRARLEQAESEIQRLRRELEAARAESATALREDLAASEAARAEAELERDGALRKLDRARARIARLENPTPTAAPAPAAAPLVALPSNEEPCAGCETPCEDCNLDGGVILYVGGERSMLPHLRRLVRAAGGELLHHDGGREDKLGALPRLCARADAVLCPVDRVGHAAVEHVKKVCSTSNKTFLPLRRASIDAFERGLRDVADRMAS